MKTYFNSNRISIFMGLLLVVMLTVTPVFQGCDDKAAIPSFLKMDTIILDSTSYDSVGSVSSKIKFAWVYVDDNLQGVYELPFVVPVIKDGSSNLKVYGGVNENGLTQQALRYPFYINDEIDVDFVTGDTVSVTPHIRYKKQFKIPYIEDFNIDFSPTIQKDQGGGFFDYLIDPTRAFEGPGCGYFYLPQNEDALICTTSVITTPKNKLAYAIEFDYKNNCDFLVGVRTSQDSETIIGILPKSQWNKIYLNITPVVDVIQGTDLKIYFIVPQDSLIPLQEVYIDNLKLLH